MNTEASNCPCCQSTKIDDELTSLSAICEDCGFVLDRGQGENTPNWFVDGTTNKDDSDRHWTSYYSIGNASELRLAQGFELLEEIATQVELADEVRIEIAELFCDAYVARITDGRDIASVLAACIRIVTTQTGPPVPIKIIAQLSECEQSTIQQNLLRIQGDLDISCELLGPDDYLSYLDSIFSLTKCEFDCSAELLSRTLGDQSLSGTDPAATAAAALYLCGESWTQSEVAEAVGVSSETIRRRTNSLKELAPT